MKTLWFVMPVHGRLDLATICLRQLRHTCDMLLPNNVEATAVVIADRENMTRLRRSLGKAQDRSMLGFGTIIRDNQFLSERFNDGIQLAFDHRWNPRPADYVVPIGSDDWVDWRIFTSLPAKNTVVGFKRISFVREDGREMVARTLDYDGGSGIRVYPRELMQKLDFRPADEDRRRGCDTSILNNLRGVCPTLRIDHRDIDPRQIVDWKTKGQQLNTFDALARHRGESLGNPFRVLADIYSKESLSAMRRYYGKLCDEQNPDALTPFTRSLARSTAVTRRVPNSRP